MCEVCSALGLQPLRITSLYRIAEKHFDKRVKRCFEADTVQFLVFFSICAYRDHCTLQMNNYFLVGSSILSSTWKPPWGEKGNRRATLWVVVASLAVVGRWTRSKWFVWSKYPTKTIIVNWYKFLVIRWAASYGFINMRLRWVMSDGNN